MSFRVVIAEAASLSGTTVSSAIDKLKDALGFARDLIEDAAGMVVCHRNAVDAWCMDAPKVT